MLLKHYNPAFGAGLSEKDLQWWRVMIQGCPLGGVALSSFAAAVLFGCVSLPGPGSPSLSAGPWPPRMSRGWECPLVWQPLHHQTACSLGCGTTAGHREIEFGVWYSTEVLSNRVSQLQGRRGPRGDKSHLRWEWGQTLLMTDFTLQILFSCFLRAEEHTTPVVCSRPPPGIQIQRPGLPWIVWLPPDGLRGKTGIH